MTAYYVAVDLAVLPGEDAYILFQGKTGRLFRVTPEVGKQLAAGRVSAGPLVSALMVTQLLDMGVVQSIRAWSVNRWTPFGRSATALLAVLLLAGVGAWTWYYQGGLGPGVWPVVTSWWWLPPAFLLTTLLHEWGHTLALRSMKGRAGRILLRRQWPWALVEVGPFRQTLPAWRCMLLLSGGMLLEVTVLGLALAGLSLFPNQPLLSGLVWASTVHLAFDLFPTPWSDGGQLVGLIVERWSTKGQDAHARRP